MIAATQAPVLRPLAGDNPMNEVAAGHPQDGGEVFNLAETLHRFLGKTDLLAKVMAAFFAQAPKLISRIDACAAAADAPGLREAAHSLKGSAGAVGAVQVAACAAELENCARGGDVPEAAAFDALKAALERFAQRVRIEMP